MPDSRATGGVTGLEHFGMPSASYVELGFPHDFYQREMVRTFVYGGMRDQIIA